MPDGAWIPTMRMVRKDGTIVYIANHEALTGVRGLDYADNSCPPLIRPEVCRKYKSVPVISTVVSRTLKVVTHYRLEETI